MYLIFAQNAIGATGFTFTKILVGAFSPFTFVMIRHFLSAGIAFSFAHLRKQRASIHRSHIPLFVLAGLGFFTSTAGGAFVAQVLPSSIVGLSFNTVPFITALLSFLLFGERLSNKKWLAMGIGSLGMIPCVQEAMAANAEMAILPLFILLFTVTSYSFGWLKVKQLVELGYAPAFVTSVIQLVGGVAAIPFSVCVEGCQATLSVYVAAIFIAIVLGTAVNSTLYSLLLSRYSPTLLSFAGTLMPCFVALYGWAFLGETITLRFLFSGAVITFGLYLFYRAELAEAKPQTQS